MQTGWRGSRVQVAPCDPCHPCFLLAQWGPEFPGHQCHLCLLQAPVHRVSHLRRPPRLCSHKPPVHLGPPSGRSAQGDRANPHHLYHPSDLWAQLVPEPQAGRGLQLVLGCLADPVDPGGSHRRWDMCQSLPGAPVHQQDRSVLCPLCLLEEKSKIIWIHVV